MGTDHWAGGRSLQEREDKPGWTISCLPQEPPSGLFSLDINYSGSHSKEPQREALPSPPWHFKPPSPQSLAGPRSLDRKSSKRTQTDPTKRTMTTVTLCRGQALSPALP